MADGKKALYQKINPLPKSIGKGLLQGKL